MKQYYFIDNNNKIITSGTVLKTKPIKTDYTFNITTEEVVFEWYDDDKNIYYISYGDKGRGMLSDQFFYLYIGATDRIEKTNIDKREEKKVFTPKDELSIDSMFYGWMWFILIMLATLFLNGFIFYWIVIIIAFWMYRDNKLKKAGYKK